MLGQVQEARKTYRNMQEGTDNVERVWKCLQLYGNMLGARHFFRDALGNPKLHNVKMYLHDAKDLEGLRNA